MASMPFMKKKSAQTNRRKKRHYARQLRSLFLDRLCRENPEVHAPLKQANTFDTTHMPASIKNNHVYRLQAFWA